MAPIHPPGHSNPVSSLGCPGLEFSQRAAYNEGSEGFRELMEIDAKKRETEPSVAELVNDRTGVYPVH